VVGFVVPPHYNTLIQGCPVRARCLCQAVPCVTVGGVVDAVLVA